MPPIIVHGHRATHLLNSPIDGLIQVSFLHRVGMSTAAVAPRDGRVRFVPESELSPLGPKGVSYAY